jgi:hypothetical protein
MTSEVELVLQVICRAFSLPIFFQKIKKKTTLLVAWVMLSRFLEKILPILNLLRDVYNL